MSQHETIRDALVTALSSLLSTNGGPLGQILAYPIANPSPPCAWIDGGAVNFDEVMGRGTDKLAYKVTAVFPFTNDVSQQKQLDVLRDGTGATSVKTLLEADRTLGGVVQAVYVPEMTDIHLYDRATGPTLVGCAWTVDIYP